MTSWYVDPAVSETVRQVSENLQRTPRATALVVRCQFADRLEDRPGEPAEPTPPGGYPAYFTSAGRGQGAVFDYLNAAMGGTRTYDADITPWYQLPWTEAEVVAARSADRLAVVPACAEAAMADFHVPGYDQLVVILNAPSTADATRGGDFTGVYPRRLAVGGVEKDYGITVIGSSGFDMNGVLQELLHGYPVAGRTMKHGRHAYLPGMASNSEYGDPYDVMGAFGNFTAPGPYGDQGGSLSAARRAMAGWMAEHQTVRYVPDDSARYPALTVELAPLDSAAGPQLVTVPVGDDSGHFYTVEHRVRSGWDRGFPADGVLIHEVRPDGYAYLMTRRPGPQSERDAQWQAGQTWRAPLAWGTELAVTIDRADASGATVRLTA